MDETIAIHRRQSQPIQIGKVTVGGTAPVSVQSMTNTPTQDVNATVSQIQRLEAAGCEIIRVAVPDEAAAAAIKAIKAAIAIPLIADIHFDHRLAIRAAEAGADGLRLNPGNIGGPDNVRAVVSCAKDHGVPIRIGVNAGSLEKELLEKYGHPTAPAMVESALGHIRILEELNYQQIKVSLKASDVRRTVEAYRLLAEQVDYPLHIGVTEAGTTWSGTIKSAIGIGSLLHDGIGDTLRVSLTGDPVEEIRVGWEILKSLDLRERGPVFISCPTCGRCEVDLIPVAEEVERRLHGLPKKISVAVMGCVVNGPGEAREADLGLAGGRGEGVIFRKGKLIRKVSEAEMVEALIEEANKIIDELD